MITTARVPEGGPPPPQRASTRTAASSYVGSLEDAVPCWVGYLVLKTLAEVFATGRAAIDDHPPMAAQLALATFAEGPSGCPCAAYAALSPAAEVAAGVALRDIWVRRVELNRSRNTHLVAGLCGASAWMTPLSPRGLAGAVCQPRALSSAIFPNIQTGDETRCAETGFDAVLSAFHYNNRCRPSDGRGVADMKIAPCGIGLCCGLSKRSTVAKWKIMVCRRYPWRPVPVDAAVPQICIGVASASGTTRSLDFDNAGRSLAPDGGAE